MGRSRRLLDGIKAIDITGSKIGFNIIGFCVIPTRLVTVLIAYENVVR